VLARKGQLVLLLLVAALSFAACGGDDDKSADRATASQTETGGGGKGDAGANSGGEGSSGGASSGVEGSGSGLSPSGAERSGGAGAPQIDRPVRRPSLARYLAQRYRLTEWYGTIVRIRIGGGKVRVYTSLDPASDDEAPPLIACRAVRAYSTRIKRATIYSEQTRSIPRKALHIC
jgi:hypothetical protein